MKKLSLIALVCILFSAFTCENEPLEGELQNQNTTDSADCLSAAEAYTTAAFNHANWDGNEDTYPTVCSAYASAIQGMIDNCGDPTGSFQAILGTLGDCSEPLEPGTCQSAIANTGIAENNFNNTTDELYTQYCTVYISAIEEQIELCGDADGSLQDIIDGLGDCIN